MTDAELDEAIDEHQEYLFYHLDNAVRAEEAGASQSQERNIADAANRAAILTALKAIRTERAKP